MIIHAHISRSSVVDGTAAGPAHARIIVCPATSSSSVPAATTPSVIFRIRAYAVRILPLFPAAHASENAGHNAGTNNPCTVLMYPVSRQVTEYGVTCAGLR